MVSSLRLCPVLDKLITEVPASDACGLIQEAAAPGYRTSLSMIQYDRMMRSKMGSLDIGQRITHAGPNQGPVPQNEFSAKIDLGQC